MNVISFLRRNVTDISLRTTLITGFPGETEQEFIEMCDFVKDVRFERLGVFTYSHEDNILSESESGNVVPENEKISRMEEILKLQENISSENNAGKIGKVFKTIIDREEGEFFAGRTEHDSPEIDNEVLIPKSLGKLETGRFYKVKITDAMEFDLFGEVVAEEQDYLE